MSNKKICILSSVHPALDVRIFYREARTLVQAGYHVTLIAQHNKNEIVDGIKIIALPEPKNRSSRIFKTTWKLFNLAKRQKADIYHFHDPELMPTGVSLKICTKAKVIYDVHEDVPKQILAKHWIPRLLRRFISIFFNFFEKSASKLFDYIITATPDIKNNFKQRKVIDIKNYPILDFIPKVIQKNDVKQKKKQYCLIYTGWALTKERGVKEIIQSLNFINQNYRVKLKLIFAFCNKNFENELKNLDKSRSVEFIGHLSPQEVYKNLPQVDIGLECAHPTYSYLASLPIKIFEYMAMGLPIIASNFPLWGKIIKRNNCGLIVNPLDPKEIARAIEYLIEHPKEVRIMGENGKKAVLEKYNWENESKKLLRVYEELLQ